MIPSAPIDSRSIIAPGTPSAPIDGRSIIAPGTPSAPIDSRSTIAPGTPVRCPTSGRVFGNFRGADSDGEVAQWYENMRKGSAVHDEAEDSCGPCLIAEVNLSL